MVGIVRAGILKWDNMNIIKNKINFEDIKFRKYSLSMLFANVDHTVHGLDTETLDGYSKLLCDGQGMYKYTESIEDILKFMTHYKFRSAHNFFFNLNYDVNAIVKYLPLENLEDLRELMKTEYGDYRIMYIPHKLFKIIHANHVYPFYDVQQFYKSSLDKAAGDYLGEEKFIENVDRVILGSSAEYWIEHEAEILKYCINDARLTQRLGQLLHNSLIAAVDLKPQKYLSKASITKELVRKRVNLPDVKKIEQKALMYAFNAYSGGRFEIIKKGKVGKCGLIDINSAYPYHIANLIDVSKGTWRRTKSLHEEAHYGFYLVKATVHYNNIAPLPYKPSSNVICYPVIEAGYYLTKEELLAYEKYIDYEIISGWEFYPDEYDYLFKGYIDNLFRIKAKTAKEHFTYDLTKILMNALYGCFYEKHEQDEGWYAGKLFNPIFATMITANTRIELFNKALEYGSNVVGFATDSILVQGDIGDDFNTELGGWSIHGEGETVVIRSGLYKVDKKLKNRGIKKAHSLRTPHGDYKNIFDYIEQKPELSSYPVIINRPLSFREVLNRPKTLHTDDINVFTDLEYDIDLNRDNKRLWDDTFACGGELFEKEIISTPIIIEEA